MTLIATDSKCIVVGLGITGLSCVRYLLAQGKHVTVVDSRSTPPGMAECNAEFPQVDVHCGEFDVELLCCAAQLVVSPGVSVMEPAIQEAQRRGVRITGDIDLFSHVAKAPIIAITGSNGKSTVTTLLAEMAEQSGMSIAVGGNLGIPALDLLDTNVELYILELSSFQLETTQHLGALAATVLNISEDHMDRYPSKLAYLQAKQRIFRACRFVIINDDDILSTPLMAEGMAPIHFGIDKPNLKKFSMFKEGAESNICYGFDPLISTSDIKIKGLHNISNVLAALALGTAANIDINAMLVTLKTYAGLKHRCEWVRNIDGVDYINDSKGTNVGATATAIESFGLSGNGKVILIAGGESKGADFTPLTPVLSDFARSVILFGQDAPKIEADLSGVLDVRRASTLEDAVSVAKSLAGPGDTVLMSPACASFDMFSNFEERGDVFIDVVRGL